MKRRGNIGLIVVVCHGTVWNGATKQKSRAVGKHFRQTEKARDSALP